MMLRSLWCAMLLTPFCLHAQRAVAPAPVALGTIHGTVFDSLSRRPLPRATVELADPARVVETDQRGNFTMDSVPVGARRLTFSAPDLDSIGLFGFARDLDVRAGVQQVTLTTPSFQTLHRTLCAPSKDVSADSAIVFGTVYDARTRLPVKNATVSFAWYAVDTKAGIQLVELLRQATTDDAGSYGRCGLPADLALRMQASAATASSGPVASVIGEARVFRRDLFISDEFAPAETTKAPVADSAPQTPRGSGIVRGTVRDEKGGALVGALVVLLASDRTVRTDSLGRYRFVGVPLGTQEMSVRQVGHGALFRTIDVAGNAPVDVSFTLPQATVLATMNVRGERRIGSDQAGFLSRQRNGFGSYLNQEELAKRFDIPAALQRLPALNVQRIPLGGVRITNTRSRCQPLIVIDGVPGMRPASISSIVRQTDTTTPPPGSTMAPPMDTPIESLNVRDVLAVEYYPGLAGIPMQYAYGDPGDCGMLLIWTVFARW